MSLWIWNHITLLKTNDAFLHDDGRNSTAMVLHVLGFTVIEITFPEK